MDESRNTIYISGADNERIERVVSALEAQQTTGLRNRRGVINKSALISYLLKYAEKKLKSAENERK